MTMFAFEERPDSRDFDKEQGTYTLRYTASGEQDDYLVQAYSLSVTSTFAATAIGILKRQNVRVQPVGFANYLVEVSYGRPNKETGSATFDFDTTGATIKVKAAKEHIGSYPSGGDDNPHKGAIEVDKDGKPQGADIVIPALKLNYRFRHPQGIVNEGFARNLARATGRVNADAFRGFAAGELLFIGATGSDGTDAEAEVAYQMVASENATDLSVGEITGIVKEGHHLAWVEFDDDVDEDGRAASPPRRVHIERVYDPIPFAEYFGWS